MAVENIKATELSEKVAEVLIGKTEERLGKGVFKLPNGIYIRCETYQSKTWLTNLGIRISIGFDRYVGCEKYMRLVYLKVIGDPTVRFDATKLLRKVAEVEAMATARKDSLALAENTANANFEILKKLLPGLKVSKTANDEDVDVYMLGSDRFDYRGEGLKLYGYMQEDPCRVVVSMQLSIPLEELLHRISDLQNLCDLLKVGKEES